MAFETIGDVLNHAKAFHRQLSRLYGELGNIARREKIKILLTYMQRHETNMVEVLQGFEADASQRVLGAWFKYPPELPGNEWFEHADLKPDMTADEVVQAALEVDARLLTLYRHGMEKARTPEARDFFSRLIELEQQKETEALRNALTYDLQE